jgi:hypothetical protein
LTVVVPMLSSVLTATRVPARSAAVEMQLSGRATTALKSAPGSPVDAVPPATTSSGRPCSAATSTDVVLPKPNWKSPLTTPGTMAAPPWPLCRVSSIPRSAKGARPPGVLPESS